MRGSRYADAAGLGQRLETRRDVYAVAEYVLAVDHHVAEVDTDPPLHLAIVGKIGIEDRDRLLHLGGAFDGLDRAVELAEDAVASGADDATAMLRDGVIDDLARLVEPAQRSDLIGAHEPAIVLDVGAQDCRELAFEAL